MTLMRHGRQSVRSWQECIGRKIFEGGFIMLGVCVEIWLYFPTVLGS